MREDDEEMDYDYDMEDLDELDIFNEKEGLFTPKDIENLGGIQDSGDYDFLFKDNTSVQLEILSYVTGEIRLSDDNGWETLFEGEVEGIDEIIELMDEYEIESYE